MDGHTDPIDFLAGGLRLRGISWDEPLSLTTDPGMGPVIAALRELDRLAAEPATHRRSPELTRALQAHRDGDPNAHRYLRRTWSYRWWWFWYVYWPAVAFIVAGSALVVALLIWGPDA